MPVAIEGLRQTIRDLEALGAEVADLKAVMGSIAAEGADIERRYAPVLAGKLRSSIRGNKAKGKAVVLAGKARVPYAGVLNYGGVVRGKHPHRIRPTNFLAKTDAALEPKALDMLLERINDLIREKGLA